MPKATESEPSPVATAARPRRHLSRLKKLGFAVLATCLFFVALEGALRAVGFHFLARAPEVQINGQLVAPMFRPAERYRWEGIPGVGPFNEDGFIGPRLTVRRSSGTLRIACLGDSCTQMGDPPYATVLRERLSERLGTEVEVLNAGIIGYSTEQGAARLERDVLPYRPDLVTLYFGWNDHWFMNRVSDEAIERAESRSWGWVDSVGWSRVVQLGLYGAYSWHERRAWQLNRQPYVARVSLDRYQSNLKRMIASIRRASGRPRLVTAATNMTEETPATDFTCLKDMGHTGFDTPKALHDAYVEATRAVARETRTPLFDAAVRLDGNSALFMSDHIHFTAEGIAAFADYMADAIVDPSNDSDKLD